MTPPKKEKKKEKNWQTPVAQMGASYNHGKVPQLGKQAAMDRVDLEDEEEEKDHLDLWFE